MIFGDEGWYLAIARAAAEQGTLDQYLPQATLLSSVRDAHESWSGEASSPSVFVYNTLVGLAFLVFGAGLNRTGLVVFRDNRWVVPSGL